jgi:hypothetical protein
VPYQRLGPLSFFYTIINTQKAQELLARNDRHKQNGVNAMQRHKKSLFASKIVWRAENKTVIHQSRCPVRQVSVRQERKVGTVFA